MSGDTKSNSEDVVAATATKATKSNNDGLFLLVDASELRKENDDADSGVAKVDAEKESTSHSPTSSAASTSRTVSNGNAPSAPPPVDPNGKKLGQAQGSASSYPSSAPHYPRGHQYPPYYNYYHPPHYYPPPIYYPPVPPHYPQHLHYHPSHAFPPPPAGETKGTAQTPNPSQPNRQLVIVDHPGPNDVLLGKGKSFQNHEGNVVFRAIVDQWRPKYDAAPRKSDKSWITNAILKVVQNEKGGRFLDRFKGLDGGVGWLEVDDKRAKEKVALCFRSKRRSDVEVRNELSGDATGTSKPKDAGSVDNSDHSRDLINNSVALDKGEAKNKVS